MCSGQEAAHLIISSDIHMELQILPAHNFTSRPGFGSGLTTDAVVFCDNATMPPSRHQSIGLPLIVPVAMQCCVMGYYYYSYSFTRTQWVSSNNRPSRDYNCDGEW